MSQVFSRRVAAVAAVALAVLGCTSEEEEARPPSDPPVLDDDAPETGPGGAEVAVVLPPRGALDPVVATNLREDIDAIGGETPEGVSTVRAYEPDDATFAADLAATFAERGVELVCGLGPGGVRSVASAADLYRGTRFCATPAERVEVEPGLPVAEDEPEPDEHDALTRLEVRVEELGHAIGVGARREAGGGAVGLLTAGDELQGGRFEAGLLGGLAGAPVLLAGDPVVEPEGGDVEVLDDPDPPVPTDDDATEGEADGNPDSEPEDEDEASEDIALAVARAEALVEAGATVVVLDGGPGAVAAGEALAGAVELAAPAAVAAEFSDEVVSIRWSVRWDRVLDPLLVAIGEEDARDRSFGFEEGAFDLETTSGISAATRAAVADAVAALVAGERDPLEPVAGAGDAPVPRRDETDPDEGQDARDAAADDEGAAAEEPDEG